MGGDWCCAVGCSNTSRKCSKVTFHHFPKDKLLQERWTRAVRRKDWAPNNNSRVCSDHFTPDSYDVSVSLRESFGLARAGQRKKLRACAVPTEFAYAPRRPPIERGALAKRRRTEVRLLLYEYFGASFLPLTTMKHISDYSGRRE